MAEGNTEIIDSTNDTEVTENDNEDTAADVESEETHEFTENEKKLYERLKKAQGFVRNEDGKWIKNPKQPEAKTVAIDEKKILEVLDNRDLESLELGDELKKEVRDYAKFKGVSVKQALNSDYIQVLKDKEDRKARTERATTGGTRRANSKRDYANAKPGDFDLRTPEGKQDYAEYESWLKENLG